jgi:DNA adenine methylase
MRVTADGLMGCSIGGPWNPRRIFDDAGIWAAHHALRACRLSNACYKTALAAARPGDFVFIDPPYVPVRPNGDIAYTGSSFSLDRQGELANLCGRLTRAGVQWMVCNSNAAFIRKLYGHYQIHEVSARRSMSGGAQHRGRTTELLITNY